MTDYTEVLLSFAGGLGVGLFSLWAFYFLRGFFRRRKARAQGLTLRQDAEKRAQQILAMAQKNAQDFEARMRLRYQKEIGQKQQRLKAQEAGLRTKQSNQDRAFAEEEKKFEHQYGPIFAQYRRVQQREQAYDQKRAEINSWRLQLIQGGAQVANASIDDMKQTLITRMVEDGTVQARRRVQTFEEDVKARVEHTAKQIIGNVLARFPREYCPERGIGIVAIPSQNVKDKLLANENAVLKKLGTLCGVDVTIQENNTLAVSGFDPVRRELTTRCLEKIVQSRDLSDARIERIFEDTKKDLFRRIEQDGHNIAKELRQESLHPEIKRMLGSLRYRYSFAQNQYYHVGEVGWLCGLLAAELGEVISDGKRSGLLHDIGKAMDHSVEGGHAVIGADFINKHGEAAHIVHAVRAHHFEEQPSTDLAFLVIAADAISGSRPGARRSTVTAYNQKMEVLEKIGEEYPGIAKTLVFNAGREVRLVVDAHQVNDNQALKLCRSVADKIENDLTYPGSIKVVVVRETIAESMAK